MASTRTVHAMVNAVNTSADEQLPGGPQPVLTGPPVTRRERQREATSAEIRDTARQHMRTTSPDQLSLRAIARDMGLTAPALYRYYDSREALITALIVDAYTGLVDEIERARDAVPADDLVRRLMAAALAWRGWALTHTHEFALVFGAPIPGYAAPEDGPTHEAGMRFGQVFLELIVEAYARGAMAMTYEEQLPPSLQERYRGFGEKFGVQVPLAVLQRFFSCWSRLHGAISLEVFGHFHFVLPDAEDFFRTELVGLIEAFGLTPADGPAS